MVANVDKLQASLGTLKNKFSIIAASETWTNITNENSIAISGYDMLVKSRVQGKGGGVALYFDSNLDLMVKPRSDL